MADWRSMAEWRYRSRWDHIRASDGDRDRVIDLLREHCAAGRLTLDEMSERIDRALRARTLGDLTLLMHDLPHPGRTPVLYPTEKLDRRGPPRHFLRLAVLGLLVVLASSRLAAMGAERLGVALLLVCTVFLVVSLCVRRAVQLVRSGR